MSFGASSQKNSFDKFETSPFQQTYLFNPQQQGQLQNQLFGQFTNQIGQMGGGADQKSAYMNQMMSGLGGLSGGVGRAGYDHASAGQFTQDYDPILKKLTEGPLIQKMLAQTMGGIGETSTRNRDSLSQYAAAHGALGSGGEIRGQIENQANAENAEANARAQAYLGMQQQAVGATENQVNQETNASMANAQASAQTAAAYMGANAQTQAAGIGARAGLYGQMMQQQDPLRWASLLAPTFTQGQQFQPIQTGSRGKQGGISL